MKKKLFAICLIAAMLIAVLSPSCEPAEQGKFEVKATLCGDIWEGDLQYTLTRTDETIDGTSVPQTHTVDADTWTLAYVSGGPAGAHLLGIAPAPTQTLVAGETITLTLHFELDQDASIEFKYWTVNGDPLTPIGTNGEEWYEAWVTWGEIIDVHFSQHVAGCEGKDVKVKEYSKVEIHFIDGPISWVGLHVLDDLCAVVKYPPPLEQESRQLFVDEELVEKCNYFDLVPCTPRGLEAHTVWLLEKCTPYEKSINWLRIGEVPEPINGDCVLFELLFDWPGTYAFTLAASAEVELLDDIDVNPANNVAASPPLYLWVNIPPGP